MKLSRREFLAMGIAVMLAGCSGGGESAPDPADKEPEVVEETVEESAEPLDFDGSGLEDMGDFDFYISTAGGTSEDGNVPQISYKPGTHGPGVNVCVDNGDGTICNIYIDGHKRGQMNVGHASRFVTFEDSDVTEGVHVVELTDDGETIYRKAQYEIVLDE